MTKRLLVVTLLFVVATVAAQAQTIATKPFVEFQGTYNEIVGTSVCTPAGYHDDESYTVNLPFTFYFNNVANTVMYITTNGYLTFGSSQPYIYGSTLTNAYDIISPLSRDLHGNYQGTLSWDVQGVSPNRVVIVQWKDWMTYYQVGDKLNFQIRLYETSNMIEFVYGSFTTAATYAGRTGIRSSFANDVQNRIGPWVNSTADINGSITKNYGGAFNPPIGYTYRFGCYVPQGQVGVTMTDAAGNAMGYYNSPGMAYVKYFISYPPDQAYSVPVTLRFYRIGDPSGQPVYVDNFVVDKQLGTTQGIRALNLNLAPGYYRVQAEFMVWNNCLMYESVKSETSTLFILAGTVLCEVWPGDVNNDMVVNYNDRRDLNTYIFDANMRSTWLTGPARYKFEAASNPMVYYNWEGQPSVPWNTAQGCYMDADGNGVVNNFDYIAIKMNWLKMHGAVMPKSDSRGLSFDMAQNYPNPFNPSTVLQYSLPERSQVELVVVDMLGRTVATLVSGVVDAGAHTTTFDATALTSGQYIARVTMTGIESGLSFSKTVKMTLNK